MISIKLWHNDTERIKPKYWMKNLSKCHFAYQKPHKKLPGIETQSPRLEAGDKPLEPRPQYVNPLNPELNPICYLLALLAHHFLHVSRIRVKS